ARPWSWCSTTSTSPPATPTTSSLSPAAVPTPSATRRRCSPRRWCAPCSASTAESSPTRRRGARSCSRWGATTCGRPWAERAGTAAVVPPGEEHDGEQHLGAVAPVVHELCAGLGVSRAAVVVAIRGAGVEGLGDVGVRTGGDDGHPEPQRQPGPVRRRVRAGDRPRVEPAREEEVEEDDGGEGRALRGPLVERGEVEEDNRADVEDRRHHGVGEHAERAAAEQGREPPCTARRQGAEGEPDRR